MGTLSLIREAMLQLRRRNRWYRCPFEVDWRPWLQRSHGTCGMRIYPVCTWFHQFPGHCKFFSQSTANQWSIKCQAFSKNRIFGHNNCNLSDGNGKEFEKHWHRIAVKKPFPSHRDETLLACDWGVDESFTTFTWFDPAGPSNDF